ncbi:hypothetical protein Trydic_g21179 [Trypoxylus dichotomus]
MPCLSERERIKILMMVGYGDKIRGQDEVVFRHFLTEHTPKDIHTQHSLLTGPSKAANRQKLNPHIFTWTFSLDNNLSQGVVVQFPNDNDNHLPH